MYSIMYIKIYDSLFISFYKIALNIVIFKWLGWNIEFTLSQLTFYVLSPLAYTVVCSLLSFDTLCKCAMMIWMIVFACFCGSSVTAVKSMLQLPKSELEGSFCLFNKLTVGGGGGGGRTQRLISLQCPGCPCLSALIRFYRPTFFFNILFE